MRQRVLARCAPAGMREIDPVVTSAGAREAGAANRWSLTQGLFGNGYAIQVSLLQGRSGCAVKADARGVDIRITTVGPIDEARHRVQQGLA